MSDTPAKPAKKTPPKFSGLVKDGTINAAPESAVAMMPPFAHTFPTNAAPAAPSVANAEEGGRPEEQAETVRLIPINLIDASRFQNRLTLTEERVAVLADNIRQDGLNSPVIVRTAGGRFELVAGETRMRACRLLGHTEIQAFVREMDDTRSARSTVLDNFFHESLTDYEVYKGLRTLIAVGAATSVRTLADITPWGKSQVQRLMAFERLPRQAIEILERQPSLIGSATAELLAGCLGKGIDDGLVARAVERIRDGKMPQTRAAAWIEAQATGKKAAAGQGRAARAVVTTAQGSVLFTIDRGPKGIKIQGAKGAYIDWDPIHEALVGLLKSQAGEGGG